MSDLWDSDDGDEESPKNVLYKTGTQVTYKGSTGVIIRVFSNSKCNLKMDDGKMEMNVSFSAIEERKSR